LTILFFSEPVWPSHPGGSGRCSFLYAAELARRGHRVFLVCSGDPPVTEVLDGVEIHRIVYESADAVTNKRTEENATARGFLNYAVDHILPHGIDLVIDVGGFLSYFFSVTSEIRRRYRIPVIVYFHLLEHTPAADPSHSLVRVALAALYDFDRGPRQRPQCFAVRAADSVICLTADDAATVQRLYRPSRLYILPPPIDPRLTAAPIPPARKSDEHLIVFAGRVDDHSKGASIVLHTIKRVLSVRSDVRLIVIGPSSEDADFSSLGSHVTCTGWISDSATLAGWLRAADLLLMPSRSEAFGMMCAEALAMGLPVIGSRVGGLPEMIVHGHNGYLLQERSESRWAQEISNRILELLSDPQLLARMKGNAAGNLSRFDVAVLGARLEEICRETVDQGVAAQPLIMPGLDSSASKDYLALLSQLGGRNAREAGEALLPRLDADYSETRCQSCCRRGIFSNVRRVARFAKRGGPNQLPRVRRAVFTMCPWSLFTLKEQARMAIETGRVTLFQIWWSKLFFSVVRRLPR